MITQIRNNLRIETEMVYCSLKPFKAQACSEPLLYRACYIYRLFPKLVKQSSE